MAELLIHKNPDIYTLIDDEDLPKINKWKWHIDKAGYARRNRSKKGADGKVVWKAILLHRAILGIEDNNSKDFCVDHINGNRLDNRKENLRIVSYSENASNRHAVITSTNTLRISRLNNSFVARIRINHKPVYIGSFSSIEEANNGLNEYLANGTRQAKTVEPYVVTQYDKDGNAVGRYNSYAEASRATGVVATNIANCAKGTRMTAGGYKWVRSA